MPGQRKPELSVTQLIAGAGATVTATVAASYFGVGGTLIGAGAVSVLSTAGATFYQHFLDRGKAQLVAKIPVRVGGEPGGNGGPEENENAGGSGPPRAGDGTDRGAGEPGTGDEPGRAAGGAGRPWPKWYVLAGAAGGIFLAVMGLVTAFELVTGRPLSNTVQGRAGGGTSVIPAHVGGRPAPGPAVTHEATPDTTPSARTTPERTPTPSSGGTPALVPAPTSVPSAPRSAVPLQPLPSDGDGGDVDPERSP
jgi:hypothetical protein